MFEPLRAGGRDGEVEGACTNTIDDGRVLKLLHGGRGEGRGGEGRVAAVLLRHNTTSNRHCTHTVCVCVCVCMCVCACAYTG